MKRINTIIFNNNILYFQYMACAVFNIIALFDLCYTIQYIHNASNRYDLYISPPIEMKYICDIYNFGQANIFWCDLNICQVYFKYM